MKHTYINIFSLLVFSLLLSGCLYPAKELSKNQTPNEAQLELVQQAVDKYKENTNGLVPIKTKENDTPIYEKYLLDFSLLKESGLISEIPASAYENGGVYQYALLDPENNPQVKLIDLRVTEAIRRVNVQLDIYRDKHMYPPFGEELAVGVYTIDYKKLGFDSAPHVKSPYSTNQLPIIMDATGKLYVDYRIELNNALGEHPHHFTEGDDIRLLLAENTPFMPAYSLPYTILNNEPVFMID